MNGEKKLEGKLLRKRRFILVRKCERVIAEPKELIDFWKTQEKYRD